MARRGFWDSFYQGFEQGDKIVERNRGLKQRADIKKAYSEDQVDSSQYDPKDFTDEAETAGGKWSEADQAFMMPNGELQVATNTPTWDAGTNSYQGAQGQSLKPKAQFSLGGTTQAERFTPDQISDYRNNRVADIYAESGDVDKAVGVRSQAQSMKLGKVQLEQADAAGKEANNVRKLMKIQAGLATGEIMPEDAIKQIIPITDKANGDGITHAYKMLEDGTFEITEHMNDKAVGSKIVNVGEAMKAALKYASPTMWAQMQQQENADRSFKQSGDQFNTNVGLKREEMKTSGDQFQQKMDYQMVSDNEKRELDLQEMGIKNKVANAQIGYYGSRADGGGLNATQSYALQQQQEFDKGRNAIVADLESGKINEVEASRKLKLMGMKFGASGSPLQEPKGNTKAQEAYYKFVSENPDAPPIQLKQVQRNLGLIPQNDFGDPGAANPAPAKAGGLQAAPPVRRALSLKEQMQTWAPEDFESNLARTVNATPEDIAYAQQMMAAYNAAGRLNR